MAFSDFSSQGLKTLAVWPGPEASPSAHMQTDGSFLANSDVSHLKKKLFLILDKQKLEAPMVLKDT